MDGFKKEFLDDKVDAFEKDLLHAVPYPVLPEGNPSPRYTESFKNII